MSGASHFGGGTEVVSVRVSKAFAVRVRQAVKAAAKPEADWLRGWLETAVNSELSAEGLLTRVVNQLISLKGKGAVEAWARLDAIRGKDLDSPEVKMLLLDLWESLNPKGEANDRKVDRL